MSSLRNSYDKVTDTEAGILLRPMTVDGVNGTDSNAAVDGSSTPVKFWVEPLPTTRFIISQVAIEISDNGNPGLMDYGSISGPLSAGVQFFTEIDGVEDVFGPPIKSNQEVIRLFPDVQIIPFQAGLELRVFAFDILEHSKSPVVLNGNTNDKFGIIIQDPLNTLVTHGVSVKGNIRLINV